MKRLFAYICMVIVICGMFVGCGAAETVETAEERFITVDSPDVGTYKYYLVDTETGVMYLVANNRYYTGITVLVDENGKPLIWEGK